MPYRFLFNLTSFNRWQKLLLVVSGLLFATLLFWVGLFVVVGLTFSALGVAALNWLKFKLTGSPLFRGPLQFHRYQSHFTKASKSAGTGRVIDGEIVDSKDGQPLP